MKKMKDKTYNNLTPSIKLKTCFTQYTFSYFNHNLFFYRERLYWNIWITFPPQKNVKKSCKFFLLILNKICQPWRKNLQILEKIAKMNRSAISSLE